MSAVVSSFSHHHGYVRHVQRRGCVREQLPPTLDEVADAIAACTKQVAAAGLRETATLLSIAYLDLKARLGGLTENELDALADISDTGDASAKHD